MLNLILFANISLWIFQPALDKLFPGYFFISYVSNSNLYLVFSIFLIGTTLLKLAEDWFYFNRSENIQLRSKNLQVETQLSSLRAQINPHFLFNALNVVYALALEQKEQTTKAIVQLSDILRYVIYDSDVDRVTLEDEINLLQNYIQFQNHRINTENKIEFDIDVENKRFTLYPMLLLPLLENSFKYGISTTESSGPIKMKIYQKDKHFQFQIKNDKLDTKNTIDEAHSGVGLTNLKNNLNLVYPDKHKLLISDNNHFFEVTVDIYDA
ncbi:MAG: histidine kinase [Psychroserpens sp.]|nr:histidine kinase [Psychroserpens sp.]